MLDKIGGVDLAIIVVYLLGIVAVGCYAGPEEAAGRRGEPLLPGLAQPPLAVDRAGPVHHEHLLPPPDQPRAVGL